MRVLSAVILGLVVFASTAGAQPARTGNIRTGSANMLPQGVPSNILLTFHLIEADGLQGTDPEIEPIVTELRRIFRFQGYRLAFKSILNASPSIDFVQLDGNLSLRYGSTRVSQQVTDRGGRALLITANLRVHDDQTRVEVELQDVASGRTLIDASVNLTSGKMVVLGSTRVDAGSGALILAVTPAFDP